MANIEHLQTVNVPASTVYEALTTDELGGSDRILSRM